MLKKKKEGLLSRRDYMFVETMDYLHPIPLGKEWLFPEYTMLCHIFDQLQK